MRKMVSLALVLVLVGGIPTGVKAAPMPPLDLQTDANSDGVADELAQAVMAIDSAEDPTVAIQQLQERFPYREETRRLQDRVAELQSQVERLKSDEEALAIKAEMVVLSEKMQEDPGYRATLIALEALYVQQGILPLGQDKIEREAMPLASWSSLKVGDVLLVRSGLFDWMTFLYAMWYSHAGSYHGSNLVYESNQDGVRFKPLNRWQQSGQYIALGRNRFRTAAQMSAAQSWAENYYGTNGRTPYNYFYPDKNTNERLYCSQLVWKIHRQVGVDVDSNAWQYQVWIAARWGAWAVPAVAIPAVAPDEVGLDSDLNFYSKGWN